jgi:uncharacterized protein
VQHSLLCGNLSGMDRIEERLRQITAQLISINPYRVILFGSAADANASDPADIDLLVILDKNTVSQNYEEKMENRLLVRRSIYEISKEIPIDLLVYTKAEYALIRQNRSSFFREIDQKGKILYEKAS